MTKELLRYSKIRLIIAVCIVAHILFCVVQLLRLIMSKQSDLQLQADTKDDSYWLLTAIVIIKIAISVYAFYKLLWCIDDIKRFYFSINGNYEKIREISGDQRQTNQNKNSEKSTRYNNSTHADVRSINQLLSGEYIPKKNQSHHGLLKNNKKANEVYPITDFNKHQTSSKQHFGIFRKNTSFDFSESDEFYLRVHENSRKQGSTQFLQAKIKMLNKYRKQFHQQMKCLDIKQQQADENIKQTRQFIGKLIGMKLKNYQQNIELLRMKMELIFNIEIVQLEEQVSKRFASSDQLQRQSTLNVNPRQHLSSINTSSKQKLIDQDMKSQITFENVIDCYNNQSLSHSFRLKNGSKYILSENKIKKQQYLHELSILVHKQIELDRQLNYGKTFNSGKQRKQLIKSLKNICSKIRNSKNIYDLQSNTKFLDEVYQINQYLIWFITSQLNRHLPVFYQSRIMTRHQNTDCLQTKQEEKIFKVKIIQQSLFPHYNLQNNKTGRQYNTMPGSENVFCVFWLYLYFIRQNYQNRLIEDLSLDELLAEMKF